MPHGSGIRKTGSGACEVVARVVTIGITIWILCSAGFIVACYAMAFLCNNRLPAGVLNSEYYADSETQIAWGTDAWRCHICVWLVSPADAPSSLRGLQHRPLPAWIPNAVVERALVTDENVELYVFGWPWPAVYYWRDGPYGFRHAIETDFGRIPTGVLWWRVVWQGTAGAVLACTGGWALRICRFVNRYRRGLCRWCGYPVMTGQVCAECGRLASKRYVRWKRT